MLGVEWIVVKFTLMWKLGKTSKPFSKYEINYENMLYIYKHLPSQTGNKVCKGLFPAIHFYYSDASYHFIHGPDPGVCESCSLTPKGQTWEMSLSDQSPTFLISSNSGTARDQGSNDSLQLFCTDRQVLLKVEMEKTSIRKPTIQPNSRSNLENLQYPLMKTQN